MAWAKTAGDGQSGSGRPTGDERPNGDFYRSLSDDSSGFSWYPDDRNGAEWQVVRGSGMKTVIWQVKGASG